MVVHNVHYNADARIVQRLYHLLALFDAHRAVVRVGRVRALGDVVVHRVVAPVVLLHDVLALVDGAEVVHRHDLHVLNAELFKVIDAGRWAVLNTVHSGAALGESKVFSAVLLPHSAARGRGKVCDRHLPNACRGGVLHHDVSVVLPVFGIGLAKVYHHAALPVHAASARVNVSRTVGLFADGNSVVVVFARQIAADGGAPNARLAVQGHARSTDGLVLF